MSQERRLNIRVNLDTGTLERDAASATSTLKGIGNEAESQGKRMTGVFKNVGAGIAATFTIKRIKASSARLSTSGAKSSRLAFRLKPSSGARKRPTN